MDKVFCNHCHHKRPKYKSWLPLSDDEEEENEWCNNNPISTPPDPITGHVGLDYQECYTKNKDCNCSEFSPKEPLSFIGCVLDRVCSILD